MNDINMIEMFIAGSCYPTVFGVNTACNVTKMAYTLASTDLHVRLDFRRSFVSGLRSCAGSFPEQRLVMEPNYASDLIKKSHRK